MNNIHAVIGNKEIHIYIGKSQFEYSHWNTEIIENVSYKWSKNNHLTIKGLKQDWRFNGSLTPIEERNDMFHKAEEQFIIKNKFLFINWQTLLKGYVRMMARIPFEKTFVNFKVVIHND
jgi:hypothetical protein